MGPQRMAENQTLLRMFDHVADGVFAVDGEQRIIYWNAAAERLLGYSRREAVGKYCHEFLAGEDYLGQPFCRRDCPVIDYARRGLGVQAYDVLTRTAAGKDIWLNISVVPVQSRQPKQTAAVHIFRDVTQRRKAEMLAQKTIEAVASLALEKPAEPAAPFPAPAPRLTRREQEVLALLAAGQRPRQIADKLGVSPATVRNHVGHILAKLGVHSRLEAVLYSTQHHLI